jgi:hypothetical protein
VCAYRSDHPNYLVTYSASWAQPDQVNNQFPFVRTPLYPLGRNVQKFVLGCSRSARDFSPEGSAYQSPAERSIKNWEAFVDFEAGASRCKRVSLYILLLRVQYEADSSETVCGQGSFNIRPIMSHFHIGRGLVASSSGQIECLRQRVFHRNLLACGSLGAWVSGFWVSQDLAHSQTPDFGNFLGVCQAWLVYAMLTSFSEVTGVRWFQVESIPGSCQHFPGRLHPFPFSC